MKILQGHSRFGFVLNLLFVLFAELEDDARQSFKENVARVMRVLSGVVQSVQRYISITSDDEDCSYHKLTQPVS